MEGKTEHTTQTISFEVAKSGTKLGHYDTHLNTYKHLKRYKEDLWFQFDPFQESNGSNPEISNVPIFFSCHIL